MYIGDPQTILRGKYGTGLGSFALAPTVAQLALGIYPGPAPVTIASAATIAPKTDYFILSGTTTVDTITVPPGMSGLSHTIKFLATGICSLSTSGNIGLGVTTAVGRVTTLTYEPAGAKYYPDNQGGAGAGSGDALVANPLSQFAATSSAQLRGVLSDETGTGVAVFATAPTITDPVIADGLTASGTDPNTFAGSSGTFITSTGINTFKGSAHNFDAVLQPTTDDAAALGTTSLGFSDLFLASGGTLHFANTNWVATHSSGILTVGTGDLRVTTAGTNTASVVTVGGTQTLTAKTLTAPTITAFTATGTSTIGNGLTVTTPVIASGLTASGAGANTFAGSTGTFITSTGANTFKGSAHNFDAVLQPTTNDVAALGTTSLGFSDLFLASGGTLHFSNTDWVATHTAGILTVGTGDLRVTTAGTNTASVATVGGTQTLTAKTLTSPVIGTGLTASGSAANTFAGSTGTFITSTGANTFKGSAHNFDAVLQPTTNDAAALGTTLLGFADLFLATGGTLHFADTDWVATHTAGILTVGTGDLRVTTAGTNTASVVTVGGTQTLAAKTLTAPVIGAATGTSLALTGGLKEGVTEYASNGAITIASGTAFITKAGVAAMTVAAPSSQDGTMIRIVSGTDNAHTITFTGSTLADGTTGLNQTVTMTAFAGSSITVIAKGVLWYLVSDVNVTSITA